MMTQQTPTKTQRLQDAIVASKNAAADLADWKARGQVSDKSVAEASTRLKSAQSELRHAIAHHEVVTARRIEDNARIKTAAQEVIRTSAAVRRITDDDWQRASEDHDNNNK